MRKRTNATHGFSMIEVMISMVVMAVIMAATIIEMQPVIQQMHANTGANLILGQLRWARQLSIAHRRDIQVQFNIGTSEIKLTELPVLGAGGGPVVVSDLFLAPTVSFRTFGGQPDTPDAFGNGAPICFGGAGCPNPPTMMFQSNGTFVDLNGIPLNGTIFLGVANIPTSGRAITVLGTTGRIRLYKGTGSGWIQ